MSRLLKKVQRQGARRPISGDVLLYVDVQSIERNEAPDSRRRFSSPGRWTPASRGTGADEHELFFGDVLQHGFAALATPVLPNRGGDEMLMHREC